MGLNLALVLTGPENNHIPALSNNYPLKDIQVIVKNPKRDIFSIREILWFTLGLSVSDQNGDFIFQEVAAGEYLITCSIPGYSAVKLNCKVETKSPDIIQIGNIIMHPVDKELDEVTIHSEKAMFNNSIDRKVFNIEKDLFTALEKTVPKLRINSISIIQSDSRNFRSVG